MNKFWRLQSRSPSIILVYATLVCWVQFTASAFSGYSDSALERLAQASSLSYLPLDKMASSPYYDTCKLEPIAQVVDPKSQSGATIFRFRSIDESDDGEQHQKLVVACRGSANPSNFVTNLKFNLVPATRLSQDAIPDNALVHEGFQDASAGLWEELSQPLMEQLDNTATSEIVYTGHSLGAATALLCATHYNSSAKKRGPSPSIVTFGGPKLCNSVLANHLRQKALEECDILHLVHSKDPVLANNEKLWDSLGFESVGVEFECDPYSPTVFGTGEKASSMFGNIAWNIVDHCKYMGVFVGPRAFF